MLEHGGLGPGQVGQLQDLDLADEDGRRRLVAKPPDSRASFAAALRAATIDGSSTTIGTT